MKTGVVYCFNGIAQFLIMCKVLYSHGVIQCTGCAFTAILVIIRLILHVVSLIWYENFGLENSSHSLKS